MSVRNTPIDNHRSKMSIRNEPTDIPQSTLTINKKTLIRDGGGLRNDPVPQGQIAVRSGPGSIGSSKHDLSLSADISDAAQRTMNGIEPSRSMIYFVALYIRGIDVTKPIGLHQLQS